MGVCLSVCLLSLFPFLHPRTSIQFPYSKIPKLPNWSFHYGRTYGNTDHEYKKNLCFQELSSIFISLLKICYWKTWQNCCQNDEVSWFIKLFLQVMVLSLNNIFDHWSPWFLFLILKKNNNNCSTPARPYLIHMLYYPCTAFIFTYLS